MSDQHTPDNQPTASMQPGNGGRDAPPTVPMSPSGFTERPGDIIGPFNPSFPDSNCFLVSCCGV
jgi:hypothetical protein